MPKYRSITMSVMSQWELKQFPEFSHPDSAQRKSQGSMQSADGSEAQRSTSASSSSRSVNKTDSLSKNDSAISCYIPSIPGLRFFLKYAIEPPHPEGQLFFFKLFMNGRHITSWGINPKKNPKGQVLRGLFEPDEAWNISKKGRTILKQNGIESRPFLFAPEVGDRSAADDGGLIEVRIFRSNGRKRRAPSLEIFRPQKQYGIDLPSAGLLDKPQDTRYYDYILVDPKDEPYAAFLFHYRSWEFLQSLQLIPTSHPRALLKPSNSFAFLAGPSSEEEVKGEDDSEQFDSNDEEDSWVTQEQSPRQVAHISQLQSSKVLGVSYNGLRDIGMHGEAFHSSSTSPTQSKSHSGIPTSAFSVPQATLDEWAYDRPLPRLPKAKSSFDHSRSSSTSSNAPSISPSLVPWLDRNSENPSPEPIIGIAVTVPVPSASAHQYGSETDVNSCPTAELSLDTPPERTQSLRPMSNPLVIPPNALFLPSSVIVRKSGRKATCLISTQGNPIIEDSDSEDNDSDKEAGGISSPPLEAEWLSREKCYSSNQRNLAPRWSFTSADSFDLSDPFSAQQRNLHGFSGENWKSHHEGRKQQDRPTT